MKVHFKNANFVPTMEHAYRDSGINRQLCRHLYTVKADPICTENPDEVTCGHCRRGLQEEAANGNTMVTHW